MTRHEISLFIESLADLIIEGDGFFYRTLSSVSNYVTLSRLLPDQRQQPARTRESAFLLKRKLTFLFWESCRIAGHMHRAGFVLDRNQRTLVDLLDDVCG